MVHLERKQNGEVIEVKFDCQNEAEMNMGDIEGEGEDEDAAPPVYISFEVIVTKGNNKMLFDCLAGEAVEIENVRFFPNNKDTSDITVYGGPRFEELDEKVQEEFYAYLEDRKIDDDMSFFILSYAREKEQSEYVHWLKNVIDFTSK